MLAVSGVSRVVLDLDRASQSAGRAARRGNFATVALGWGVDRTGRSVSRLQLGALPLASAGDCADSVGAIAGDSLCAGDGVGRVQTCPGDSGGPLLWLDSMSLADGTITASVQVGIVSWGASCETPSPYGVFVDVAAHADWIRSTSAFLETCVDNPGACETDDCPGGACVASMAYDPAPPMAPPASAPPEPRDSRSTGDPPAPVRPAPLAPGRKTASQPGWQRASAAVALTLALTALLYTAASRSLWGGVVLPV